jgi:hypothetical protein
VSGPVITDTTCGAFRRLPPAALQPDRIHRFVVGEDTRVRVLDGAAAAAELGDPFATHLLLEGIFPRTAGEVLEELDRVVPAGDPLREGFVFLLGEGSQIPMSAATAAVERRLRFLVARGISNDGADVLVSAFHPDTGDVELMAWDRRNGGFNYYQTVGASSAWVFGGNSRHALSDPTQGKGPFESHLSGALVMKELRFPWLHWHSFKANILPSVLPKDPPLVGHPWVTATKPDGAEVCELSVAIPGIRRWTRARFDRLLADDGVIEDPRRIMLQILGTPSINIVTGPQQTSALAPGDDVILPTAFFVDLEALSVLGLPAPPRFSVPFELYRQNLADFQVRVEDGRGFVRPGDTFFPFAVPETAFEDLAVLEEALRRGLLTPQLATCLLMTDFPNPVFSRRRAALLAHVPAKATLADGASTFSDEMGDAIAAAAPATPQGSPEREFAERWSRRDDVASFGAELQAYYDAVTPRLRTQAGYDDYVRLAEARRDRVRPMPIFESRLLFARTNVPSRAREMRADGSVVEV